MRLWWDFESAIVLHQCNLKIQMHKNSPLYCIASRKTRDANAWLQLPRLNKQRSKVPSDLGNQDLLFWQRWEELYVWLKYNIFNFHFIWQSRWESFTLSCDFAARTKSQLISFPQVCGRGHPILWFFPCHSGDKFSVEPVIDYTV